MILDLYYSISQRFLIVCSLYATIVACIYRNRFNELKYLFIYPFASLTETVASSFLDSDLTQTLNYRIRELLVNIFLVIELISIYVFFIRLYASPKIKRILSYTMIAYLSITVLLVIIEKDFALSASHVFVPQAIIILAPSFMYLYRLFSFPADRELKNDPAFWVVTGLILYFGGTLPLFLLNMQFDFYNELDRSVYTINFYCYGILFLFIIKAFLCKKREISY
jgi:hypothetical protein